jgi:outer membrane protein OmpA-like peptidoglycan-associated protein
LSAQKKDNRDCENATHFVIETYTQTGLQLSPKGIGKKMEFNSKTDSLLFEKEHNIAWFQLKLKASGDMTFQIIPDSSNDNFDFLLYYYDGSDFCSSLNSGKLRPVRTNLSKNDALLSGRTGLALSSKTDLVGPSGSNPFSSAIKVKTGQQYYLVIDKVNESKGGFNVVFTFPVTITIEGTVTDENEKPISSEITLTGSSGEEVGKAMSDSTGKYSFGAEVGKGTDYYLTFYNDSSFIASKVINSKKPDSFKGIKTVMPKLRGGKKYVFENINFYSDSPEILPSSLGSLEALYMLMKKNRRLVIEIDGHVNGPGEPNKFSYQKLSVDRAEMLYKFLVEKGINSKRLSTKGFGNTQMLFPFPHNDYEQGQNRRVEINVIKIK